MTGLDVGIVIAVSGATVYVCQLLKRVPIGKPLRSRPIPGSFWVEGDNWHFIDEHGIERRVQGGRI